MKPLERKNYGSIPHLSNSKLGEGDYYVEKGKLAMSNKLKKIGITNSVYPNCIYIKNKKMFFEYILNHNYSIPESYKYKF